MLSINKPTFKKDNYKENKESKSIFIEVRGKKIEAIITKRPFI